jgi:hypothetical protein
MTEPEFPRWASAATILLLLFGAGLLVWAYQPTICKTARLPFTVEKPWCKGVNAEYPGCEQRSEPPTRSWCWLPGWTKDK